MKLQRILVVSAISLLASAGAASALQWGVTATAMIRVVPTPGGLSNKAIATGFHRLTITTIQAQDLIFPVRFKINKGELLRDLGWMDNCATGWIWGWNETTVACKTTYTEYSCVSAYWEARTVGSLQLHPQGGTKQIFTPPVFASCECT